ncbi:helix-turn-helix domain-containing protein [Streptomyces halobius]|uniref:Helix-turn-helix domain-containing protein n=1 Tax=Streptomyces halobius TaxID=2879846 RepID=A0ABY4M0X9_9ACTN|nr:helix-turn-helix domain-containing protein [Streptomyces halobius]UQA90873.1 helix-turn-helix domain-containing protein [Streptomyces halobius]
MTQRAECDRFAACLRTFKERAGFSYGALAKKTGSSRSSLHRYCSGSAVPLDYGTVHHLATVCGASSEELRRLHKLWALADASRDLQARRPKAEPALQAEPHVEEAAGAVAAPDGEAEPEEEPADDPREEPEPGIRRRRWPWQRQWQRRWPGRDTPLIAVAAVLALSATIWSVSFLSPSRSSGSSEQRPLFSDACSPVVSMGEHDECVRELQRLLSRAGADIEIDSSFGPQTLRRVTAFQVFAGMRPNGIVGEQEKEALYESRVRLHTWPREKVRERIREVFPEAPHRAVKVADCQSLLDPLHILPNTDGTRNWGVFQISDARLRDLAGTPRDALDPEWNIQSAKRLWSRSRDFRDWPNCSRA